MKKTAAFLSTVALLGGAFAPSLVQAEEDFSAVIITDVGGVDDKSFNQSAWEGLQAWGEENGKSKGNGIDYLQSEGDSDYLTNLNNAVNAGFNLIFGIGYKLEPAITEVAANFPDQHFVIVDSVIEADNVASLTFKDHESSFLVGVAAAKRSKSGKLGFVGGVEGVVIDRFEAGFVAGAKAVNPDIDITVEYAGGFADAPRGRQIASTMFANGVDVIFHASGATGNGVFSEAKDLVSNDPSLEIFVCGVDMDQDSEGVVEIDGEERYLTLTSALKEVGAGVKNFIDQTVNDGFKAGHIQYGLADGGVNITTKRLTKEEIQAVEEYREKIVNGEIEVPETPER